jgi:hypothetical protein
MTLPIWSLPKTDARVGLQGWPSEEGRETTRHSAVEGLTRNGFASRRMLEPLTTTPKCWHYEKLLTDFWADVDAWRQRR